MTLNDAIGKYLLENNELKQKMDQRQITLDKVCDYVIEKARKELDGKNGAISDEVVFGWVVHFIEDAYKDKEQPEHNDNVEVKTSNDYEQLNLFEAIK